MILKRALGFVFLSVFMFSQAVQAEDATKDLSLAEKVDILLNKYDTLLEAKETLEKKYGESQQAIDSYKKMLDEKESDINLPATIESQKEREKMLGRESQQHDFNLEVVILSIAFLFLIAEFFYIKRRGDI